MENRLIGNRFDKEKISRQKVAIGSIKRNNHKRLPLRRKKQDKEKRKIGRKNEKKGKNMGLRRKKKSQKVENPEKNGIIE